MAAPGARGGQNRVGALLRLRAGPVPEMADDSSYYQDAIHWLVEHKSAASEGFLVKGAEHPDAAEAAKLKQTSCDVHASVVCDRAWYAGYRLSRDFYMGDRPCASRASIPAFVLAIRRSHAPLCSGGPEQPSVSL